MRQRYLIVDGHSIIFAWPALCKLHKRRPFLAREALINRLRDYQDWTGVRVVVVFDGHRRQEVGRQFDFVGADLGFRVAHRELDRGGIRRRGRFPDQSFADAFFAEDVNGAERQLLFTNANAFCLRTDHAGVEFLFCHAQNGAVK